MKPLSVNGALHKLPSVQPKKAVKRALNEWLVLPYAFYTPETNAALGVLVIRAYPSMSNESGEPSVIQTALTYTSKSQKILKMLPHFHLSGGRMILDANIGLVDFADKFFGVGNIAEEYEENFIEKSYTAQVSLRSHWYSDYHFGLALDLQERKAKGLKENGALNSGNVAGVSPYNLVGGGWILDWDTRNYSLSPTDGLWYRFSGFVYNSIFGSSFDYVKASLDLRNYWSLGESYMLASQVFLGSISGGEAPFQELWLLGGDIFLRGTYRGRYRDRAMQFGQLELRSTINHRWLWSVFTGLGEVGTSIGDLRGEHIKRSVGFGLHYFLDTHQRTKARLDFGWSEGERGVYLILNEAF